MSPDNNNAGNTAKNSLIAWWVLILIALFVWYRNQHYDRVYAVLIFIFAIIQLIEYGIASGVNNSQAGKAIFVGLWLQILVIAIAVYIYVKTYVAAGALIMASLIFLIVILYVIFGKGHFSAFLNQQGFIEWKYNGEPMLYQWGWLYLLFLLIPFLLLLVADNFRNIGIPIFIAYGIATAIYVYLHFPLSQFGSIWTYLSIGFAFLVFYIGMFMGHPIPHNNV